MDTDSDNMLSTYKRPDKVIHYGDLSREFGKPQNDVDDNGEDVNEYVDQPDEYIAIEVDNDEDSAKANCEIERRKFARTLIIPTDDVDIKRDLRLLGQPICLFGEDPANRRNRLRETVSKTENGNELLISLRAELKRRDIKDRVDKLEVAPENRTWYHEGPMELKDARLSIARYSLDRAGKRVRQLREESGISETLRLARQQLDFNKIKQMDVLCSQIADCRPISACSFHPCGKYLATGSWSGTCKIWSTPDCTEIAIKRGHSAQVGSVVFRPVPEGSKMAVDFNSDNLSMASCDQNGVVNLWSWKSEVPIAELPGHSKRVASCKFHHSGRYLATAVYDHSWRLWDVEQRSELLHQEGHSRPVHCLAFHPDGSLLVSGSQDSYSRVWDLRTGQCVMLADGHLGAVVDVSCAPNGYHFVTGSVDHSIKIWDLRQRRLDYTLPAHTNVVSGVTHFASTSSTSDKDNKNVPLTSTFLISASYDGTAQIWSSETRHSLMKLKGHDSRIMSVDVTGSCDPKMTDGINSMLIATTSFDRTFKLWSVVS